jgi:hypothetical protein
VTAGAVRLRYRGPDPAWAPSVEERQAMAAWVTDVLAGVDGGAYQPVHVAADEAGYDVTLRVDAADSYQAILSGSALVAEWWATATGCSVRCTPWPQSPRRGG